MRYVVGYAANARGADAVNLAVALARRRGAALDLVMVLPEDSPYNGVYPPEAGYETILARQVAEWLDEALARIPADVPAQAHIRRGESEAETLIAAAEEFGAGLLVIGASSTGLFKRFTVGSVAGALLHASPIPVALAPSGYSHTEPLTRVTCGLGTRAGAADVLEAAVVMARERKLPLRLVSLLALDTGQAPGRYGLHADGRPAVGAEAGCRLAVDDALAHLRDVTRGGHLAGELDRLALDVVVGQGRTIENAVDNLDWQDGEVLLIGSSRLAQGTSIFLGPTANRILRSLPVPMIVVPRNYPIQGHNEVAQ